MHPSLLTTVIGEFLCGFIGRSGMICPERCRLGALLARLASSHPQHEGAFKVEWHSPRNADFSVDRGQPR